MSPFSSENFQNTNQVQPNVYVNYQNIILYRQLVWDAPMMCMSHTVSNPGMYYKIFYL